MTNNAPCRKDLLCLINRVSFAVDDVKLFLTLILAMPMRWPTSTNTVSFGIRRSKNMQNITDR